MAVASANSLLSFGPPFSKSGMPSAVTTCSARETMKPWMKRRIASREDASGTWRAVSVTDMMAILRERRDDNGRVSRTQGIAPPPVERLATNVKVPAGLGHVVPTLCIIVPAEPATGF